MSRRKKFPLRLTIFPGKLLILTCLFLSFTFPPIFFGQDPPEITNLALNNPLTRKIANEEKQIFQIALTENQYAKIIVEQKGVDVLLRLFGLDENTISVFDSEIRLRGYETIEIVASTAGIYKVQVETKLKNTPSGFYEIRLSELRDKTELDSSLQEARNAYSESKNLQRRGNYAKALDSAEKALAIWEKTLGKESGEAGEAFNQIGMIYYALGDSQKSEFYIKKTLETYQKVYGNDDLNVAHPLNNLAVLSKGKGEYSEAEKLYKQALEIREKALGKNHTLVASTLNNLGILYRNRGDYEKAQEMYERALDVREKLFGTDSTEVASVLVNLAALSYYKGDYDTALEIDQRVLKIREKNFGAEHPSTALSLVNLGLSYTEIGEYEKAEPLLLRALKIIEDKFGKDHINSVSVQNNLAQLYFEKGNSDKAETFFLNAVRISEKKPGEDVRAVALYLNNLGNFYSFKGDYEKAETYLKRSLEIRLKILGEEHIEIAKSYNSLARLYALKGDLEQAITLQIRSGQINEKSIDINLAVGTEHQKLSYMSLMWEDSNQTIALHAKMAQENTLAREQAVTTILQRKGRILDVISNSLAALHRSLSSEDQLLLDRFNDLNAKLADLFLSGPEEGKLAEHREQIDEIQKKKNKLESEISQKSSGFYKSSQTISLKDIQRLIPVDSVLIEFVIYQPFDTRDDKSKYGEPHYAAYLIENQGAIKSLELGEVKTIDNLLRKFKKSLSNPQNKDFKETANNLDQKLMLPIRKLIGKKKQLLISPDGDLNLFPFEALVDENDRFLIENYAVSYLSSGRDLLRMQTQRESKGKALVIANPAFGEPDLTISENKRKLGSRAKRKSITATRNLSDTYFAPLGGTAREARSIQAIFPDFAILSQAEATESALKEIKAPEILHIATHGFFLEDKDISKLTNAKTENPLLHSGLALAGANNHGKEAGDDGILTALEASGLNLWGTKLVVLSACDTGLGEVKNGEGVYGLRRSFVIAGTESLVMSLWSISDDVTRELMTNYYKNLKLGMGRGEALRQVQLEMLKKPNRRHPFYWASFIQSGEWANLEGKR